MAIQVLKGTARVIEGMQVECTARDHKIIMDEPENLGGTDKGMNPIEATLCALGACKCIVAQCFAKAKGVNIEEIKVEVEGDLDPDGFLGKNKDAKIGLQNIRTKFFIKSDSPKEKIEEFVEFVDRTCPVADSLQNPANLSTELIVE